MKRPTACLAAIVICAICSSVYAVYAFTNEGMWPKNWPKELEPLRKQSRTLMGPETPGFTYEIPMTRRDEFEAAWPHALAVKSKGAPVILVRSPYTFLNANIKGGVVVHCPPGAPDHLANPEAPIPGQQNPRVTWMNTSYIELVVDGDIVDLNRIPLPADTPIIDERFKAPNGQSGVNSRANRAEYENAQGRPATPAAEPKP
jgi:hypothetical protein